MSAKGVKLVEGQTMENVVDAIERALGKGAVNRKCTYEDLDRFFKILSQSHRRIGYAGAAVLREIGKVQHEITGDCKVSLKNVVEFIFSTDASPIPHCPGDFASIDEVKAIGSVLMPTPMELAASMKGRGVVNQSKRERLKNMKVFVLDNSLRESTVAQLRGHTLDDKITILKAVKECKFQYIVVAAFSMSKRVDDVFVSHLKDSGEDMSKMFAFIEDADATENGNMLFGDGHIPIGLQKMKELGVQCPIIEIDVAEQSVDWDTFDIEPLIKFLLTWSKENLLCGSNRVLSFINIRDFPIAMCMCPERTLELVATISKLPKNIRPMGILVEEPTGTFFSDECGQWVRAFRTIMDSHGFCSNGEDDGLLVCHVHKQWGMADGVVLDMLAEGCDGIWCSVSEEGAAQGHACSAVTLANLARLGNKDVTWRYNTSNLCMAARTVGEVTTGKPTHPRQPVYGVRAIEAVFDFSGVAGSLTDMDTDQDGKISESDRFSLAQLLGVEDPPVRITTLSSARLIVKRLEQLFGKHDEFTEGLATKMQAQIQSDLQAGAKHEYTSILGIIGLYKKVNGAKLHVMDDMEEDAHRAVCTPEAEELLRASKDLFVEYVLNEARQSPAKVKALCDSNDDKGLKITYKSFYTGFLQPYFGCYSCTRTKEVLQRALDVVDTDNDISISWDEWRSWLYWALQAYPKDIDGRDVVERIDSLNEIVIRKAILPNFLHKRAGGLPSGKRESAIDST